MAWTKTIPIEAEVSNSNIKVGFYLSDQQGTVRERIRAQVSVLTNQRLRVERSDTQAAATLSETEMTSLVSILVKLRNAALADLGFEES